MKIEVTDVSLVRKTMAVEVDADQVSKERETILRGYASQAKIPGFRPGKAPRRVIEQRFAREVEEDLKERLISRTYLEAIREKGLRPLGDPALEDMTMEDGQPFRFKTTFEVAPEFEPKKYQEVEVRRPAAVVADPEVDDAVEQLRQAQARLEALEGRPAAVGDVVVVDLEGDPQEGEPFRRERVMIEIGAEGNLPEFDEKLSGAEPGADIEFSVSYPEDHESKAMAGKSIAYRVKVHELKQKVVPELDDEFARDIGEFDDLQALRAKIREDLVERKRVELERAVREQVLDKVLLENPVPLPDVLVENEIRRRLEDMVQMMVQQGVDPATQEFDWKQLRDRQEEPARRSVHARLVIDRVAEAESIEVGDDEVDERLKSEAERIGESYEKLKARLAKDRAIEALKNQMVREKSLDFLVSVANIRDEE